jgi:hypothetical protein
MLGANAFHAENTEKDKQSPQRKKHILRAVASSRLVHSQAFQNAFHAESTPITLRSIGAGSSKVG